MTSTPVEAPAEVRADVPEMLRKKDPKTVPEILRAAAALFEERNATYGNNYKRVGPVMAAMFDGQPVVLRTAEDFEKWHLFELMIVKLTRFAVSGLKHMDSIHDNTVYSAMVESVVREQGNGT